MRTQCYKKVSTSTLFPCVLPSYRNSFNRDVSMHTAELQKLIQLWCSHAYYRDTETHSSALFPFVLPSYRNSFNRYVSMRAIELQKLIQSWCSHAYYRAIETHSIAMFPCELRATKYCSSNATSKTRQWAAHNRQRTETDTENTQPTLKQNLQRWCQPATLQHAAPNSTPAFHPPRSGAPALSHFVGTLADQRRRYTLLIH